MEYIQTELEKPSVQLPLSAEIGPFPFRNEEVAGSSSPQAINIVNNRNRAK